MRFLASLPGYVYTTSKEAVFVNLYVAGTAKIVRGGNTIVLTQKTKYPWDGNVKLTVEPAALP